MVPKTEAQQRPDFLDGLLARDLPAQLGVEVLGTGAGRLAGDGEAVAQHQYAEGQQVQRLGDVGDEAAGCSPLRCREVVLTGNFALDVSRRHARRGQALGLDFILDLVSHHSLLFGAFTPTTLIVAGIRDAPSAPVTSALDSFGIWYSMAFRYTSAAPRGSGLTSHDFGLPSASSSLGVPSAILPSHFSNSGAMPSATRAIASRAVAVALFTDPLGLPLPALGGFLLGFSVVSLCLLAMVPILHRLVHFLESQQIDRFTVLLGELNHLLLVPLEAFQLTVRAHEPE